MRSWTFNTRDEVVTPADGIDAALRRRTSARPSAASNKIHRLPAAAEGARDVCSSHNSEEAIGIRTVRLGRLVSASRCGALPYAESGRYDAVFCAREGNILEA